MADKVKLNERQEMFCQLYINGDKELFGNGVRSYLEVYEPDKSKPNWYKTACSATSRLLSNVKVMDRIRELLENGGFNEENIEKQHLFLVNQHTDLGVKMRAISDYYKLKGKYSPDKKDITLIKKDLEDEEFSTLMQVYESNKDNKGTEDTDGLQGME